MVELFPVGHVSARLTIFQCSMALFGLNINITYSPWDSCKLMRFSRGMLNMAKFFAA